MSRLSKNIMRLTPEALLSTASRQRFIEHVNKQPSFISPHKQSDQELKRMSAVLVPLCMDNDEVSLLYTLRSTSLSNHSGEASFPGGKTDENESIQETALRETEEEVGIPSDKIDVWTNMTQVQGGDKTLLISPVVGYIKDFNMKMVQPNENEVADVFTIPIKVFCDTSNHACFYYKNVMIPVYNGGKHRVWGITGMITHLFLKSFLPNDVYHVDFTRKVYKLDELKNLYKRIKTKSN